MTFDKTAWQREYRKKKRLERMTDEEKKDTAPDPELSLDEYKKQEVPQTEEQKQETKQEVKKTVKEDIKKPPAKKGKRKGKESH